eukprot:scaffold34049_cov71-Cyclotella_meneghiniana.AAC.1
MSDLCFNCQSLLIHERVGTYDIKEDLISHLGFPVDITRYNNKDVSSFYNTNQDPTWISNN